MTLRSDSNAPPPAKIPSSSEFGTGRGLTEAVDGVLREHGVQAAYNHLLRAELCSGGRKPTLAIYDHAFHFIGGAQKYGLTLASALRDRFDITILANKECRPCDFLNWYGLDLSDCPIKIIPLPYYEDKKAFHIDPAFITRETGNPFDLIARESGRYDVFVNNSMNEMVCPLSNVSVMICHFPERRPRDFFYADRYTAVVYNSLYTASWIRKKWNIEPHRLIYPPVDMETGEGGSLKKNVILSVARFEPEGNKRQREMIETFLKLSREWPEIVRGWTFVLVGGSPPDNAYLSRLEMIIANNPAGNVKLKINIPADELKSLYRDAALFWHVCGLTQEDPGEIEHFGMTAVEAMQNGSVPLVFDGGGLREIVDHGVNGFLISSKADLLDFTVKLIRAPLLVEKLGLAAREKARTYTREKFENRARTFFDELLERLTAPG
jgi:glycosyltransferase involved in cell wall biosynthesis